jgi:predicted glycoside hydrolase/deacetylase ChbG (UPF0249 family)
MQASFSKFGVGVPQPMPSLIINADDFGMSSDVSAAILESFKNGWCSSATLMVNMPGAEEAAQLAIDHRLTNHIGLHLDLDSRSVPQSDAIKSIPRFCDSEGRLSFSRRFPTLRLDNSEKSVLANEIRAQIDRCRSLGTPLTHVDSHHHVHTEWAIGMVLIKVAKENNISYVRLTRNTGAGIQIAKKIYKSVFNQKILRAGFARTRFFGDVDDYLHMAAKPDFQKLPTSFEVMVHPVFDEAGKVIDWAKREPLGKLISKLKDFESAESFTGHRYSTSHR